jgi:hypothetical protein
MKLIDVKNIHLQNVDSLGNLKSQTTNSPQEEMTMRTMILGFSLLLSALFSVSTFAGEPDGAKNREVETVRKTCECVRRHPNGFPYIEPRITTCKTYKNAQGHVKSLDCLNCYALCSDKTTG